MADLYEPLPPRTIRILRLLPEKAHIDPIKCELLQLPLPENTGDLQPYEALSYVWGSGGASQSILVSGTTLRIGQNLYQALLRLRHRLIEKVLWIDAICINQADNQEKEHQIPLMLQIYQAASRVIVWLGEEADHSTQALNAIVKAGANPSRTSFGDDGPPSPFQIVPSYHAFNRDPKELFPVVNLPSVHAGSLDSSQNRRSSLAVVDADTSSLHPAKSVAYSLPERAAHSQDLPNAWNPDGSSEAAVFAVLERPWWSRVWVVQEVISSRYTSIMCGSAEVNGQAFCLGVLAMAELLQQRPDILGWVMPIVNAMTASTSSPSRAKLRPIAELVDMYHTRHATVNHDMLYALQGMSSDTFSDVGIILDYSRQWNQVLYSLVLFLLPRVQRLHVPHNTSCAGIIHAARMICKVTNVKSLASDVGYQVLEAESYESIRSNGPHQMWHIPNSATPVQADDFICLFEGALRPAVVRAQGDYFEIVIIAASWPRMDPSREPYRQRRQQVINEVEGFALLPFVWDWKPQVMVEKRNAHHRDLLRSVLDLDQLIDERYVSLAYLKKVWSISMEISPFLRPQDKELVNVEDAKNKAWNAYRTAHALPDISLDNSKGLHLVSWAVLNGCEQLAKDLVRDGADLNLVDYYGRTALSYAAECANVGLAHLLLANGARSIIDNPYRESPLSHAIDADHNKLAQLLLFLLDTPGELRTRWFLQAIRHGLIDLVHILILCGFDAKCGSQRLITCLPDMVASISADLSLDFSQLSRVELDRPEDYNDSPEHFCPLLTAIDSGSEGMVRLLVENGANAEESVPVERMRSKNVPPLIYAVDHGTSLRERA
ncbi:heterokaryon incompatibility protein-domain-containing protein [Pestalotiopsis sp. NC0098]|nr:heterokaryon incompatibility protein-domain-containing protein [Pestalotiopsis sp. NC0098]